MRSSSVGARRLVAVTVALTAITLLSGTGPGTQPRTVIAQAAADEDEGDIPPRRRGVVPPEDESESPRVGGETRPFPRLGASRRLDPFDAVDERMPPAPSSPGVVICLAGCDGPRGETVYRRKQ